MADLTIVKTPLIQKYGGQNIAVYLETSSDQVKMNNREGTESNAQLEFEKVRTDIDLLKSTLAGNTTAYVVNSISERDSLQDLKKGDICWVVDATGDSTVTAGAALYIWDSSTWKKISEVESLDVVLEWSNIQNKPTSNVADIDDAVSKRHEHANKDTIDKFENSDHLTFNSNIIPFIADAIISDNILSSDGNKGIKDAGIPTSDVQDAIDKKHEHTNKNTLDKITEESDSLLFNGNKPVSSGYVTVNSNDPGFDAAVAALKLPDGAFFTVILP